MRILFVQVAMNHRLASRPRGTSLRFKLEPLLTGKLFVRKLARRSNSAFDRTGLKTVNADNSYVVYGFYIFFVFDYYPWCDT